MIMKEIYPIMNNVMIEIHRENPYKRIFKDNEIEMTNDFINPDSGMIDELENNVFFGEVIEAGPECEFVKPGDDIIFDHRCIFPVPFLGHEYWMLNEQSIKAVIAEGLTERYKNYDRRK